MKKNAKRTFIVFMFVMVMILSNGLVIAISAPDANDTASIEQFGAVGDGVTDDTNAIQQAFNSSYKKIIFSSGSYKLTKSLSFGSGDKEIIGNNTVIFTDDDYNSNVEWLINVKVDDIKFSGITIEARETINVGYKSQIGVMDCSNIEFNNCVFTIPSSTYSGKEYCNVDLYTGWHNVTIQNCTFTLKHDGEAGTCLMARDLLSKGSSGLKVLNNKFYKTSHDEIFWLVGTNCEISDVVVDGNWFEMEEGNASASVVCITIGSGGTSLVKNVSFVNNTVIGKASHSLFSFGNSDNVRIAYNDLTFTRTAITNPGYVFNVGNYTAKDLVIEENRSITVNSDNGISIFNNAKSVFRNNKNIVINTNVTDSLFSGNTVEASGNIIKINGNVYIIGNNQYNFTGNNIYVDGYVDKIFQYYQASLVKNAKISGNYIEIKKEKADKSEQFLMANTSSFNNFILEISDNEVITYYSNPNRTLYYINLQDGSEQTVKFIDNTIEGFTQKKPAGTVLPKVLFLHTVTFDLNGGITGGGTLVQTVSYGENATVPSDPTKANSVFDGWFTSAAGGTEITDFSNIAAKVTYYAQYAADTSGGSAPAPSGGSAPASFGGSSPGQPSHGFSAGASSYTHGSGKNIVHTTQKAFSDFNNVRVDSQVLKKDKQFKVENGSTVVTLFADYLETLDIGEHKLEVYFNDGAVASANFTVEERRAEDVAPYTVLKPTRAAGTKVSAQASSNTLVLNGKETSFPAVVIDGYNYLKLRDIAALLNKTRKQFNITYNTELNKILINSGIEYSAIGNELSGGLNGSLTAITTTQKFVLDNKTVSISAYNIDGYNYFRLRDIAILLNFGVTFDGGTVRLDLTADYAE